MGWQKVATRMGNIENAKHQFLDNKNTGKIDVLSAELIR